jgi:argininosuccinate synthase
LPINSPDEKECFEVTFEGGWPVKVIGKRVEPFEAFDISNKIAGKHGIGIARHLVENRFVGIKSRGVYEMPGITLLGKCYGYLLEMVLDRRSRTLFNFLSSFIGQQIYEGYWFAPASQAATSAVESFAKLTTGTIAVDLYKGQIFFKEARDVVHGLYSPETASMESVGTFDHADSEGFLRILSITAKSYHIKGQIDYKSIEEKLNE